MKQTQSALVGFATFLLWLVSVILTMLVILILRDAIVLLYAWIVPPPVNPNIEYGTRYWLGLNISNFSVLILAILALVFVVGTGEYHYRHWGTRGSWRLLAWSLGGEALVLILGWLI